MNASFEPLQVGQPIQAIVSYSNVGREAAPVDVFVQMKRWTKDDWNSPVAASQLARDGDRCLATNNVFGQNVAYPTAAGFGSGYSNSINSNDERRREEDRFVFDDDIKQGNSIVIVQACVPYKTVGEIHHTAMCFFYLANRTPSVSALNICDAGNAAD